MILIIINLVKFNNIDNISYCIVSCVYGATDTWYRATELYLDWGGERCQHLGTAFSEGRLPTTEPRALYRGREIPALVGKAGGFLPQSVRGGSVQ